MEPSTEIQRVAVVGTGVVGASWSACFLAHGLDVVATDPAPGAEEALRRYVATAWPDLEKFGLAPGAAPSRLRFTKDLEQALAGSDLVQGNGPEHEPFNIKLFTEMDAILPSPSILASTGGPGGIRHFFEQFAGPMTAWWADLGSSNIARPELQKKIVEGVAEELEGRSFETLSHKRDALLTGLLELRARHG